MMRNGKSEKQLIVSLSMHKELFNQFPGFFITDSCPLISPLTLENPWYVLFSTCAKVLRSVAG